MQARVAYDLPDLDGAECCRRLKADPDLKTIPIVLVCNEHVTEHQERSRAAGSDAILTKPLDRTRFLEIDRSFLAGVREPRRHCLIRVRILLEDRVSAAKGLDISTGGLFVESGETLTPGTVVQLELPLCRPGEQGPGSSAAARSAGSIPKKSPSSRTTRPVDDWRQREKIFQAP